MEMDLVGIKNQNEYYTNHYFTSIFKDNADETVSAWKKREREEGITLPWHQLRDTSRQYYRVRDRYKYSKNEEQSKPYIQEMAELYLDAMGYGNRKSVMAEVSDNLTVPVFHEEVKSNGAPLLWAFLCVAGERDEDILQSYIYRCSRDEEEYGQAVELCNGDILAKLFFAGEEAPRFIILIGINQIALIDRNKWSEKRFLQFNLEDIFSRHSESTFMAMTVLLHKESLCPNDGGCVLDSLDENSHKHSAGVSEALKYALRESIEILGNEVIYDMSTRQGINLDKNPVNASELTLECLRYMYRFLFMLFIEARPELGYAPMKSQTYVQGYSLEGLRDVCARVKETSEIVSGGYYICDTITELFNMIYKGYPENLDDYKKALEIEKESMHDAFTIEALKAHIFDPEYTKLITNARLRNSAMLQIVDLMSISRPNGSKERRGRISYSALGINQMGAVYEALLSYRGFIAEETLFEVKKAGEKFNELDVGYFIPERELDNYKEEERVRVDEKNPKSPLRKYEKGTFIYRLAGREREKSASYYTPEVLTKCLVKYALKELLEGKTADEILNLTICEPAMGSAAFLNEAINQIAEAYLNKKQEELGQTIEYDKRFEELQKVKMFIADRNVYGVDLNPIAVELAEVSLWLNTIYKGAYVPWFGTQLVCGNSLIGARRQVYYTSKLEKGKWYDEAPIRVMPGEKRKRTGVASRVYHFLLGDSGMANYTDKVIKGLEPDNIKKIKDWNKEFTKKYDEDDIATLLRLSEIIDTLWERTVELRKSVEKATSEPLSVFGHEEDMESSHTTIREKDEIYHKLFKSEKMNNAGPYARLKAAMDYWCALWFWPINKADLLPNRQEFFFDMSLILEGGLAAVKTQASGQMSLLDDSGNMQFDENGNFMLHTEGTQLGIQFSSQLQGLGEVNLDYLRSDANTMSGERLKIANQIAEQQRFQHWELEFADVFEENGGFDLVIGNPPWLKMTWNEQDILSETQPLFAVKKYSAREIVDAREKALENIKCRRDYFSEYEAVSGIQNFSNSTSNYEMLQGLQANLYECFLPRAIENCNSGGIFAFVHPETVFNDSNAIRIREELYPRLRKHFRFSNALKLFADVHTSREFGLNVFSNKKTDSFDNIFNVYTPATIDEAYDDVYSGEIIPIRLNGERDLRGNKSRIISVGEKELKLLCHVVDGTSQWKSARLMVTHTQELMDILMVYYQNERKIESLGDAVYSSMMWDETNAQKSGIIRRNTGFPRDMYELILSGNHIGTCNPLFNTPRENCSGNNDTDSIDLLSLSEDYLPRSNYEIACDRTEYFEQIPETPWDKKYTELYRIACRKMIDTEGARTLMPALIPPKVGHTNGVIGFAAKSEDDLLMILAEFSSLPIDFFIKLYGKSNFQMNMASMIPMLSNDGKYSSALKVRIMLLNCLTINYGDIWNRNYEISFLQEKWGKIDAHLNNEVFDRLNETWTMNTPVRDDYARRQLMVEIDVLVAMGLGLQLEQLLTMYEIQFSTLKSHEANTWYDVEGKIVFTNNRSLSNVGVDRKTFESNKDMISGKIEKTVTDTTVGTVSERSISYIAPFVKCDRKDDYIEVWHTFEERFANK